MQAATVTTPKKIRAAHDFEAVRLRLASPDTILEWSHGEVLKPETINYRTQKPERDGLFCERIFGPTKDWECYCGKYKRIRYKGIVCDKCGVEVTRSIVRRERMGHIGLAVPVSHIWFLRGVPSKIGAVLDLSVGQLEKVIYFASYIITSVDEAAKDQATKQIAQEYKQKKGEIDKFFDDQFSQLKQEKLEALKRASSDKDKKDVEKRFSEEQARKNSEKQLQNERLEEAVEVARKELKELKTLRIISELEYRDLSMKYGHVFKASIGAEALRGIVEKIDLDAVATKLEEEIKHAVASKKKKITRRLKVIKGMKNAGVRPEWMFITMLPVIPPDLRPMVQLDGGRFAASDLNDLYRRVINRNNRLKRLIELNSPEVICRNEKRMLQEAVDALIDNNARRGKAVASSTGQKRTLKSLADLLKGKQGRFRQNLLGKRVDYSGRSVIVVGPTLKLNQCGIPKKMALELYKPFVIHLLIDNEFAYNVRSAGKLIEQERPEVWDMLETAIEGTQVLLNRAPTLHRLGIQAFNPVLVEGKAIQLHPMVCTAFNADFDGDQMAVHLPLTEQARAEAKNIMLATQNLLKPATGEPIVSATQDMVLGAYYMTGIIPKRKGEGKTFAYSREAILAYESGIIDINAEINVRLREGEIVKTSAGRILFNLILPKEMWFINEQMNKKSLKKIISRVFEEFGRDRAVEVIDEIKKTGFEYLTRSGLSWGIDDLQIPDAKEGMVAAADKEIDEMNEHFRMGLLSDEERYAKTIEIWSRVKADIEGEVKKKLNSPTNPVHAMIESGARGSWGQTAQMTGMRGLMASPSGRTIELPIKNSFKEGLDVLEYFVSTHGARKGMSDTALRTANAGYLTRRLVDVSQDVVVTEEDCGDKEGFTVTRKEADDMGLAYTTKYFGRAVVEAVVDPKTGEVLVQANEYIDGDKIAKIEKAGINSIHIRSVLHCKTARGICQKCYGFDLGNNRVVNMGSAVGIVAAQSIGEPGTQLTMRTFQMGGIAGGDITQGLPRVEELLEARAIKKPAVIAEFDGKIEIEDKDNQKTIKLVSANVLTDEFPNDETVKKLKVKNGDKVEKDQVLFEQTSGEKIKARNNGIVRILKNKIMLVHETNMVKEYPAPRGTGLWVAKGDLVTAGTQLTEGHLDLRELFAISGLTEVQKYIIREVQNIYSSQGQDLNDKHIEIIIRQMFSRVRIVESGDTTFLPDEVVSRPRVEIENKRIKKEGGRVATTEDILLGITKASLSTDSFLAAASFIETAKVLIDAAVSGKVDYLNGLKENVIIGKLIPAGSGYLERQDRLKRMKGKDLVTLSEDSLMTSERIGQRNRD
jgi:DNA-directed RNA polymerase subunit beta'